MVFKIGDEVKFVVNEPSYDATYSDGKLIVIETPYANEYDGEIVVCVRYPERNDLLQVVAVTDLERKI